MPLLKATEANAKANFQLLQSLEGNEGKSSITPGHKIDQLGLKANCIRCEAKPEANSKESHQSHQCLEGNEAKLLNSLNVLLKGMCRWGQRIFRQVQGFAFFAFLPSNHFAQDSAHLSTLPLQLCRAVTRSGCASVMLPLHGS